MGYDSHRFAHYQDIVALGYRVMVLALWSPSGAALESHCKSSMAQGSTYSEMTLDVSGMSDSKQNIHVGRETAKK